VGFSPGFTFCHRRLHRRLKKLALATVSYQGMTLQVAEEVASPMVLYQGMTSVVP
jgi:hypothetical protein